MHASVHHRSILLALVLLAWPSATAAQDTPDGWYVEAFTGAVSLGPSDIDDDTPFGLRLGWKAPHGSWGLDFEYARLQGTIPNVADSATGPVDADLDFNAFDVSLAFYPVLQRRFQLAIIFGPGWMSGAAKVKIPVSEDISRVERLSRDTFTVNAGLGARIFFNENVYVRLDVRARYSERRNDDEIDQEYTIGIGLNM